MLEEAELPQPIVFPTRVGVDRQLTWMHLTERCFPHTRGGGADTADKISATSVFSPHAWGWTSIRVIGTGVPRVFPTRVGVDLRDCRVSITDESFPHTRGGGPAARQQAVSTQRFSPHAWGWTALTAGDDRSGRVFPTRVGVDRGRSAGVCWTFRFPHTRGGGPELR